MGGNETRDRSINQGVRAGDPPLVVAEMSGNHNGDLSRALDIVAAVADAGCPAIKIQTYTADTITIDVDRPEFRVQSGHKLWGSRTLYDLYREAHTPWEWHDEIFSAARARGVIPFSTPFDPSSVEFLESLDVALYKTASAEMTDLPLLREVGRTGKPVILSTGMATITEIGRAVDAVTAAGCPDLTILACTAAYPARPEEARLSNIATLQSAFGLPVGLSDHTPGIGVSVAAVALGATVIEKHVTLDREAGGVDAEFSLNPQELGALVRESKAAAIAVRSEGGFGPTLEEATMLRLRRSLYVVEDVEHGDPVTASNVRSIRPAGGLEPDAFRIVEGRTFTRAVSRGTPLTWDLI